VWLKVKYIIRLFLSHQNYMIYSKGLVATMLTACLLTFGNSSHIFRSLNTKFGWHSGKISMFA